MNASPPESLVQDLLRHAQRATSYRVTAAAKGGEGTPSLVFEVHDVPAERVAAEWRHVTEAVGRRLEDCDLDFDFFVVPVGVVGDDRETCVVSIPQRPS